MKNLVHNPARRFGRRLDPQQESAEIPYLISLKPHSGCPKWIRMGAGSSVPADATDQP
ncbi:hypothetical protein [Microvirga vignae]|uniref:hypothetical protein n=1 Tax=Microvirga vignae TaxID=1225564 RepID=UPI001364AAC3|nr:hypothetical protein [Microvirga vignae]